MTAVERLESRVLQTPPPVRHPRAPIRTARGRGLHPEAIPVITERPPPVRDRRGMPAWAPEGTMEPAPLRREVGGEELRAWFRAGVRDVPARQAPGADPVLGAVAIGALLIAGAWGLWAGA